MNLNADSAKFIESIESDCQKAAGAVVYEEEAKSRNLVASDSEPLISCSAESTGAAIASAKYATNQSGGDGFSTKKDSIESNIDSSLRFSQVKNFVQNDKMGASHSAENDKTSASREVLNNEKDLNKSSSYLIESENGKMPHFAHLVVAPQDSETFLRLCFVMLKNRLLVELVELRGTEF